MSQPFWISGPNEACGEARRRHAPDYLLTLRDGSLLVVDVKPARTCDKPEVAVVLGWTGRVCRARGWRYEVFHGEDPVMMANLRFLAMGRRSMFLDPDEVAAVAAAGVVGATLADIEATVTGVDRLDVRACALALLWRSACRDGFGVADSGLGGRQPAGVGPRAVDMVEGRRHQVEGR